MSYQPEVQIGQKYRVEVNGKIGIYKIVDIRATNVSSACDYIIAVRFKNTGISGTTFFEDRMHNIIENKEFELITN